jgi:glycosyltransferase involved in cell wall biosynthesis
MRIAHIITCLDTGGAELMLYRLARHMAPLIEQRVYSLTGYGHVADLLREANVEVEALGIAPRRPNPLKVASLAWRLRSYRPDVVLTWLYHADLVGGIAARMAGVRSVAWNIRNSDLSAERNSPCTLRVVWALARLSRIVPSRIVTCSNAAIDSHVAVGYPRARCQLIPNGFDLDAFTPNPERRMRIREGLQVGADTPLIGCFARFDPQKNHEAFITAAGLLHAQRPDVHFVLAGRGIDSGNAALREWIRNAGIAKVTHLLGERHDMPALNAAIDLASLSSLGEAFPNVLCEAMACGVPCVTTDAGDSARIVGNTGLIVRAGDTRMMAAAWSRMLSLTADELRAYGRLARKRIAAHYSIQRSMHTYEDLFRDLVQSNRTDRRKDPRRGWQ